jgi:hypothetical protein
MIEDQRLIAQNIGAEYRLPAMAGGGGTMDFSSANHAGPSGDCGDDVPADFEAASGAETFPPDYLEFRPDLSSLGASRD